MNEYFIAVDVETTGPTPGKYSMYELGACIVGRETLTFERKINLLNPYSYEKATLDAMGIITPDELVCRKDAVTPKQAMNDLAHFVTEVTAGSRPIFVGHNAPFDWMFVAWYFEQFQIKNPFGHNALDMKSYFMGISECTWKDTSLENMARYIGVTHVKLPHRSLDDAIIQSKIFAQLLTQHRRNT